MYGNRHIAAAGGHVPAFVLSVPCPNMPDCFRVTTGIRKRSERIVLKTSTKKHLI